MLGEPLFSLTPDQNWREDSEDSWMPSFGLRPTHLLIGLQDLGKRGTQVDAQQSPHLRPEGDPLKGSVLEKLRTLEELREEGLISEEEYFEKRKQILERL